MFKKTARLLHEDDNVHADDSFEFTDGDHKEQHKSLEIVSSLGEASSHNDQQSSHVFEQSATLASSSNDPLSIKRKGLSTAHIYEPPCHIKASMTKEELSEWKKEQRKLRNRASARVNRDKILTRVKDLETEVEKWKNKYKELETKYMDLERRYQPNTKTGKI